MSADVETRERLAIHDPAALAWGARMMQVWLERRRARLAAEQSALSPGVLPDSDDTATVSGRVRQPTHDTPEGEPQCS